MTKFISVSVVPVRKSVADDPTKYWALKSSLLEAPRYALSLYAGSCGVGVASREKKDQHHKGWRYKPEVAYQRYLSD